VGALEGWGMGKGVPSSWGKGLGKELSLPQKMCGFLV